LAAALVLSCTADDTGVLKDTAGTTSEVDTGTECVSDVEDDLADPYLPTVGQEGACDDALYWDKVPGAVSFFLGDFTVDSCGDVSGEEAWVLFPNAKWQEVGGESCVVVWNVAGLLGGPLQEGSIALQLSLTVDTMATDCEPNDDGVPVYVGETSVTVDYDVQMNADGTAVFRYPDSGVQLGEGSWNAGHLTYTSNHGCKFF
jgi:hypothetical protein